VALLVRTWNVFHGNAVPPERRAYLRAMVELVTADRPDVVCLQEVPLWAFSSLERWSGMSALHAAAAPPLLRNATVGRWVTELHHGVLRSAVTGEGLAILLVRNLGIRETRTARVGRNRVLLGVTLGDGTFLGDFHVTGGAVAAEQFRRVVGLVPDGPAILAGDVNMRPPYELEEWSKPLPESIDQILVRGLTSSGIAAWPVERRRVDGRLLSDHAPVEMTVG
jgi:endonuclease/exonuclease/phosphatase family metal-dependent hydrolase